MERMDKIKLVMDYLSDTYTIETFQPKEDYQKDMMERIIKHEAYELHRINDLTSIEIRFIQLGIR